MDTLIAAQVLAKNLILVTHHTRHFERIPGLQLEGWVGSRISVRTPTPDAESTIRKSITGRASSSSMPEDARLQIVFRQRHCISHR